MLWEKAKILQRDISVGNILIVEKEGSRPFAGFLHDFDYSSMAGFPLPPGTDPLQVIAELLADENLKERTVSVHHPFSEERILINTSRALTITWL